jgi:hypothetical protein
MYSKRLSRRSAATVCCCRGRNEVKLYTAQGFSPRVDEISVSEFTLHINGQEQKVSVAPATPLLWICDTLNLTGNVNVENGRIAHTNFGDYQLVRKPEAPIGIGEPPVPPFSPARCGAIHAATRNRMRSLLLPPS